jgi:hypothetical protein
LEHFTTPYYRNATEEFVFAQKNLKTLIITEVDYSQWTTDEYNWKSKKVQVETFIIKDDDDAVYEFAKMIQPTKLLDTFLYHDVEYYNLMLAQKVPIEYLLNFPRGTDSEIYSYNPNHFVRKVTIFENFDDEDEMGNLNDEAEWTQMLNLFPNIEELVVPRNVFKLALTTIAIDRLPKLKKIDLSNGNQNPKYFYLNGVEVKV